MYCSACGSPLAAGLSFCNRCGMSLKQGEGAKHTAAVAAFLTAITILGVAGLGVMVGGALALTQEAHLKEELVGVFMLFTFLIVLVTEILLVRQLSGLVGNSKTKALDAAPPPHVPAEFRPAQQHMLVEPLASVTENTTRTLRYSHDEPSR